MSLRASTLPSLAVIGAVVLLASTGATIGPALNIGSDTSDGSVTIEDVKNVPPRTVPLNRDDGIKLRRTRERVPAAH